MSGAKTGLIVVLSAPSGGGKTTLAAELLRRLPNARRSITTTTRPPRTTEIPGQDYHFVSANDFDQLEKTGGFAETALVHGHRYGSTKSAINKSLDSGEVVILTIDVQGAKAIKSAYPKHALTIFVNPPDFDVLETRLRKRGTENDSDIRRRLENARREIAEAKTFDFQVLNDQLERAVLEIESIIQTRLAKA